MGPPSSNLTYNLASRFFSSLLIPIPYLLFENLLCDNVGLYQTPFFSVLFL